MKQNHSFHTKVVIPLWTEHNGKRRIKENQLFFEVLASISFTGWELSVENARNPSTNHKAFSMWNICLMFISIVRQICASVAQHPFKSSKRHENDSKLWLNSKKEKKYEFLIIWNSISNHMNNIISYLSNEWMNRSQMWRYFVEIW